MAMLTSLAHPATYQPRACFLQPAAARNEVVHRAIAACADMRACFLVLHGDLVSAGTASTSHLFATSGLPGNLVLAENPAPASATICSAGDLTTAAASGLNDGTKVCDLVTANDATPAARYSDSTSVPEGQTCRDQEHRDLEGGEVAAAMTGSVQGWRSLRISVLHDGHPHLRHLVSTFLVPASPLARRTWREVAACGSD